MDLSRLAWRKASKSSSNGGNCVEVARNLPSIVAVRDSKDAGGPKLVFSPESWESFTAAIKADGMGLT